MKVITHDKVLFISSWYPSASAPFFGNFVKRHAEAVNAFFPIVVLTVQSAQETSVTEVVDNGVATIRSTYIKSSFPFSFVRSILNFRRRAKALNQGYAYFSRIYGKPCLIHLNIAFPYGLFVLKKHRQENIPYVVTEHWSGYRPENISKLPLALRMASSKIFRYASCIMPVTEKLGEQIQEAFHPKTNFRVIPNTLDTRVFHPAIAKTKNAVVKMLHVSTLDENAKNIFGMMRAMKRIYETRSDLHLHIVHEYPSQPHLNYAQELGLLDRCVFFRGSMTPLEVSLQMQSSDFFLLFSNYENLPVVLLEALACGLPIIATTVGGIPSIVSKDFGILVNPGNEDELVRAILDMGTRFQSFEKEKLRKFAEENFADAIIGKQLANVYSTYAKRLV